ncbi:E3 ubiquitin-protein ligase TRIM33-like, partial [Mercenaria mercenaria]|uniref:E3 ubiquitin-protein ligase TRIM33-like n=1 Tax=Mercenaria mercenaria TaxID=6596 RepID=UPI00234EC529
MAVSGRKVSGIHGSVSKGSAEDFDHRCEPCLAIGQHIQSRGFCVDCQEYLCKNCFAYHKRTKASKHHQLLDKSNMGGHIVGNKSLAMCTEKCVIHKKEIIKFFCTDHEFLGCTDCITLNHRTCKIDYIPDKCAGIGDSDEYRKTLRELDRKMKDIDAVIKLATLQDKQIESSYDH